MPKSVLFLGSHGHGDHMEGDALAKEWNGAQVMAMEQDVSLLRNIKPGAANPYVDRNGFFAYVDEAEKNFQRMLQEQQSP